MNLKQLLPVLEFMQALLAYIKFRDEAARSGSAAQMAGLRGD